MEILPHPSKTSEDKTPTRLSVVTTMYGSENYVREFYDRTVATLAKLDIDDYEMIFVDDGSPDGSLEIAKEICQRDRNVKIIELSRNFGHHKAAMTGLMHADADYIFLIDVDLEEEPELLERFWNEINQPENRDVDVVYGVQEKRKGSWFKRWSGDWFYLLLNLFSGVRLPVNPLTAKIMTRRYCDALVLHKDQSVFFLGLSVLAGFNQKALVCKKLNKGLTTYSFSKRVSLAVNALTSFSAIPLHFIFYTGFTIFLCSLAYIVFVLLNKLFFSEVIGGWTSTIVSIYFLGGLILLSIGIVGIYLSRIFEEVKDRPYVVVKAEHEKREE